MYASVSGLTSTKGNSVYIVIMQPPWETQFSESQRVSSAWRKSSMGQNPKG